MSSAVLGECQTDVAQLQVGLSDGEGAEVDIGSAGLVCEVSGKDDRGTQVVDVAEVVQEQVSDNALDAIGNDLDAVGDTMDSKADATTNQDTQDGEDEATWEECQEDVVAQVLEEDATDFNEHGAVQGEAEAEEISVAQVPEEDKSACSMSDGALGLEAAKVESMEMSSFPDPQEGDEAPMLLESVEMSVLDVLVVPEDAQESKTVGRHMDDDSEPEPKRSVSYLHDDSQELQFCDEVAAHRTQLAAAQVTELADEPEDPKMPHKENPQLESCEVSTASEEDVLEDSLMSDSMDERPQAMDAHTVAGKGCAEADSWECDGSMESGEALAMTEVELPELPAHTQESAFATAGDAKGDLDTTLSHDDVAPAIERVDGETAETKPPQRVFHVQATLPQDLTFHAPKGCVPGQLLCVQGPHGPLHVQAPPGVKAGRRCTVRLAPPWHHEVFVPAGAVPGQRVTFLGENDAQLEAIVPPGKKPGQVFLVAPPAVMVPVPVGAVAGDLLSFMTPDGQALLSPVPDNFGPGQYFAVEY